MPSHPESVPSSVEAVRTRRTVTHVALVVTTVLALVFEPRLWLHIVLGWIFVGLVVVHLAQRRRTSVTLLRRIQTRPLPTTRASRLALADVLLLAFAAAMLASGIWDWLTGHPTQIRWHAITGVVLTGLVLVHVVRRRRRLVGSQIQ